MSRDEIRELQNAKLRFYVQHKLPFSPYYRDLFQRSGLSFKDIQTVDDLVKLPFTRKEDVAPTEDDRSRPRQFILQPDEKLIKKYAHPRELARLLAGKIARQDVHARLEWEYKPVHTHFTTGRTALPTAFTYSARDIELLKESARRLFDVAGATKDDRFINGFPYAPHLAFWLAYHAAMTMGLTSLHTGGGKTMGTEKIIRAIERMPATIATFIPGYAYHLMREAVKLGADFSALRFMIFGGERVSTGLREKTREMLEKLGAKEVNILATYAFTESKTAWIQCAENSGYHLYPDLECIELVDKKGTRVSEDEEGEIVYTSLDWRGSAVVRYRTGDVTKGITYGPCPSCGRTVPRLHPDIQRSSEFKEFNLTNVKGQLVNLNNFFPLLSGMKEIEEWQVELRKEGGEALGLDEIVVYVAPHTGQSFENVKQEVERRVRTEMDVTPIVEEKPLAELLQRMGMETELKEKRILDSRPR
ncbi:MAG: AMP-binding protein [Candidatus Kerfeldbacteria bacterium]|nr:AMP-binding protein [Candidatus Kerfeldbacteria bacterium]